ncbi:MAG: hypothetical protein Q4G70_06565 [Pseudomonadota bacterium]|nr:hypothetical protein [Pseudomonadota bacterium]
MNAFKWTLAATAMASLMALGTPALAQKAAHDHGSAPQELTLNQGQKWGTDAPLRKGMDGIRALVAPKLDAAHAGKLSADQYRQLAGQIELQVADIVKNCKLEPAADEQLHGLIAEIGAGVDAMNGKTAGTQPVDGLLKVTHAVNQYPVYFDHPGFRAILIAH